MQKVSVLFGACLASVNPAACGEGSFSRVGVQDAQVSPVRVSESRDASLGDSSGGLVEQLSSALAQNEVFTRQIEGLRLRLEALGFGGGATPSSVVEQRLLGAVSDLRNAERDRVSLRSALSDLVDALTFHLPLVSRLDPETAVVLDSRLKAAVVALDQGGLLAVGSVGSGGVLAGQVVRVHSETGVILVSVGSQQNVMLGAPFRVERGASFVGHARAVDVRSRVSALLLEGGPSGRSMVSVGDTVRLDVQR